MGGSHACKLSAAGFYLLCNKTEFSVVEPRVYYALNVKLDPAPPPPPVCPSSKI
jgi:hypothetical protein